MIKEIEKGRAVAITSYCDTEEKINVLIDNISLLRSRFPDYKIVVHANYPLPIGVQKLVDIYLYEDLNYVDENKQIYYWDIMSDGKDNGKIYFDKKFFYSIPDFGYSVFQQIAALTEYLIDYERVLLINYDTAVEEIRPDDYSSDDDLIVHWFPGHTAYSLIIMFFNPKKFIRATRQFNFENWNDVKRSGQLNEERFHDMVHETYISILGLDYKVGDRVSNEPDYKAPPNPYFTNYLLCHKNNEVELYLWELKKKITYIVGVDENEYYHKFINYNEYPDEAFNCTVSVKCEGFKELTIVDINHVPENTDIKLKIKKGYETLPI